MDDPFLSRELSREIDRRASDEYGISGLVLMENAGRGVVDVLERLEISGPVAIFCGGGNNGGDGFVVSRHLQIRGYDCRVLLLADVANLSGDALTNYRVLEKCDLPIFELASVATDPGALRAGLDTHAAGAAWIVDALLGTGTRGEPRPPLDNVIEWINAQPASRLAVDIPSGLDCDTGEAAAHTVRAEHTCTFVAPKQGFTRDGAEEFTGSVHVVSIGTPPGLLREVLA